MRYKLDITPQSHVRSTQNDGIFFRIPENQLYATGLARKKRLERYNSYKREIWALAHNERIIPLLRGGKFEIVFFMPSPKSFRPVAANGEEHKQKDLEGKPCKRKPDADNLLKAVMDALFDQDSFVWDVHVQKLWTLKEKGWIEIYV